MMRAALCSISFLCITYFQIYKIIFYENESAACIIFFVGSWAFFSGLGQASLLTSLGFGGGLFTTW